MLNLYEDVFTKLEANPILTKFLWLAFDALDNMGDFPDIEDQLIGEWDHASWGMDVKIIWKEPFRTEVGYLFTLPGLEGSFVDRALIHIPQTEADKNQSLFFTLRHLACVAETIELETSWLGI